MWSSIYPLLILCLFAVTSLFSQGNDVKNDSLQVEELYTKAIEIKDTDLVEAKKKFENAIEIIDKSLLSRDELFMLYLILYTQLV